MISSGIFNKYSGHSFKLNFPNTEVFIGDIQEINEKKIHKEIGDIDFIIGGPPCQSFSSAGRRAAGVRGTNDDRGTLFDEIVKVLEHREPKCFILENAPFIAKHDNEETWKYMKSELERIGYEVS